jgi:ADP-heptose:LPS heptosyltransferase
LESISPDELALELLNQCLRGNAYSSELLEMLLRYALSADAAQARRASHALFGIVVERLGDLFEPCLADCYAALFSEAIAYALPDLRREDLLERFRQIRVQKKFRGPDPQRVFVLSRVTLGADVAITSLVLDAAKRRFPHSRILFMGPRKNFDLFAADARLEHQAAPYVREGSLAERLSVFTALRDTLWADDAIVIDPDSRLTQLGLLPVCPEDRHFFFESRSFGEYSGESLPELTRSWLANTFGVADAKGYVAPEQRAEAADITVSLGVGENPAKRLDDPFERRLLETLASSGDSILVDRGCTEEEAARVDAAVEGLSNVRTWTGSFAAFARSIAGSKLYLGYDSAGQHVAAATGVPLVTVFSGHASDRFFLRWRPYGLGPREIIRVEGQGLAEVSNAVEAAVARLRSLEKV